MDQDEGSARAVSKAPLPVSVRLRIENTKSHEVLSGEGQGERIDYRKNPKTMTTYWLDISQNRSDEVALVLLINILERDLSLLILHERLLEYPIRTLQSSIKRESISHLPIIIVVILLSLHTELSLSQRFSQSTGQTYAATLRATRCIGSFSPTTTATTTHANSTIPRCRRWGWFSSCRPLTWGCRGGRLSF